MTEQELVEERNKVATEVSAILHKYGYSLVAIPYLAPQKDGGWSTMAQVRLVKNESGQAE
jgi:ATP phosphoribosyltransferase regulatory subunit HisZ